MTRATTRRSAGSPGFGVSGSLPCAPASRYATTARGTRSRSPRRSRTASASPKVVGSALQGPEPITSSRSPITSETTSSTTRAPRARLASRPPLTVPRCLRTQLSSSMSAPAARRSAVVRARSSCSSPAGGAVRSAEAPPESSTMSASSRSTLPARASASRGRMRAALIGYGVSGFDRDKGAQRERVTVLCDRQPAHDSVAENALPAQPPSCRRPSRPQRPRSGIRMRRERPRWKGPRDRPDPARSCVRPRRRDRPPQAPPQTAPRGLPEETERASTPSGRVGKATHCSGGRAALECFAGGLFFGAALQASRARSISIVCAATWPSRSCTRPS